MEEEGRRKEEGGGGGGGEERRGDRGKSYNHHTDGGKNISCFKVIIYILARACRLTATELSDQVALFSGPKLTVSMFCLCIFSSTFFD